MRKIQKALLITLIFILLTTFVGAAVSPRDALPTREHGLLNICAIGYTGYTYTFYDKLCVSNSYSFIYDDSIAFTCNNEVMVCSGSSSSALDPTSYFYQNGVCQCCFADYPFYAIDDRDGLDGYCISVDEANNYFCQTLDDRCVGNTLEKNFHVSQNGVILTCEPSTTVECDYSCQSGECILPDLEVWGIDLDPNSPVAGETFTVNTGISNNANVGINNVRIDVWVEDYYGHTLDSKTVTVNLAADASYYYPVDFNIEYEGGVEVRAEIDRYDVIDEENEYNNDDWLDSRIYPGCNYDLTCDSWETTESCSTDCCNELSGVYVCYGGDVWEENICGDREEKIEDCDSGNCESGACCDSHADRECYNTNMYWKDSCGNREELAETCDFGCNIYGCLIPECDIPDGSNAYCSCDSSAACPNGYYCDFGAGTYHACREINYEDECQDLNEYSCISGDVYQCISNGNYKYNKLIDTCGSNEYCDDDTVSTGSCAEYIKHLDIWMDSANVGVNVKKLRGDKVIVNIYSEETTIVNLSYDPWAFIGSCVNGENNLSIGVNTCYLQVREDAETKTYDVKVEDSVAQINVVDSAELIIVTHSEQLQRRYPNQKNAVDAVLAQAYEQAEEKGLVYDLYTYRADLPTHPFESLFEYDERITESQMQNNNYAVAASSFISDKCVGCKYIELLGDDFVIPYYRRSINTKSQSWFFFEKEGVSQTYTDTPYYEKQTLTFSNYYDMFKIEGRYEGKNVIFVLPDSINTTQRNAIERLKTAFDDKGYNPDYFEINQSEIACYDTTIRNQLRGKTLIIIGSEEENRAISCYPFIEEEVDQSAILLQPNVWDTGEYSLVLTSSGEGEINFLSEMVESGALVDLKGEGAYIVKVGTEYAGYAAMAVGVAAIVVGSGGTAAPAALLMAGIIADGIADGADVVDSCVVNPEGVGWCGAAIGFVAVPLVNGKVIKEAAHTLARIEDNTGVFVKLGLSYTNSEGAEVAYETLFRRYFKRIQSSDQFGQDAFVKVMRTEDDHIDLARGIDDLMNGHNTEDFETVMKNNFPNAPKNTATKTALVRSRGTNIQKLEELRAAGFSDKADELKASLDEQLRQVKENSRIGSAMEQISVAKADFFDLESVGKKVTHKELLDEAMKLPEDEKNDFIQRYLEDVIGGGAHNIPQSQFDAFYREEIPLGGVYVNQQFGEFDEIFTGANKIIEVKSNWPELVRTVDSKVQKTTFYQKARGTNIQDRELIFRVVDDNIDSSNLKIPDEVFDKLNQWKYGETKIKLEIMNPQTNALVEVSLNG